MTGMGRTRACCGFTLIEIALVLAVIGVIAAAIFVAAGSVEYNVLLNRGSDELGLTAVNMRALYQSQNVSALSAGSLSNQTLAQEGVFPAEMLSGTAPSQIVNNPWNQNSAVSTVNVSIVATAPRQFDLEYTLIPSEVCADLIIRNSQPGVSSNGSTLPGGNGLAQISVTPTSGGTTNSYCVNTNSGCTIANSLPVTAVNAATACETGIGANNTTASTTFTIDWFFNLGT